MAETAFDSDAFLHAYPDGIDRDFWFAARHRIVTRLLKSLAPAPGRVLDIGCGRGFTVQALRSLGWDAQGVDLGKPSPLSAAAPFVMLGQDAFELGARESYQALLLLDVLEHLEDAPAFLRRCRETFPASRGILCSVPACPELWSNYDVRYKHFRRYNPDMLRQEAEAAGYAVACWGYAYHALYLPLRLSLALGRDREVVLKAPRFPALHALLGLGLSLEQQLLPRSLPGTSLFAILKPQ